MMMHRTRHACTRILQQHEHQQTKVTISLAGRTTTRQLTCHRRSIGRPTPATIGIAIDKVISCRALAEIGMAKFSLECVKDDED